MSGLWIPAGGLQQVGHEEVEEHIENPEIKEVEVKEDPEIE